MKAERWKQIDGIFQAAFDRGGAERAAFLDQACAADPSLRDEVEALISSHEKAGSFIEAPVFEAAAELVVNGENESLIGRELGAYKITEVLGVGGMGEVYLAQDRRLGRRVALKLLPAFYTRDPDRLRRFEMEARSASALNHPNILTIFDVGEIDGVHFIATEYVEGETLRSAMRHARMSLAEVLDACAQASSALAAAHAAGIVHRDMKPENIMLRPDRYVKVLDFGLAKLTESQKPASETALTVIKLQTDPGTIVGTAYYMSPEQARAQPVDGRTDIFSLGVVLYEMVTGQLPFQGETTSDIVASILRNEPKPLAHFVPDLPGELQRIVSKSLRKDREERYQSVRDLMVDLRTLKQEMEIEAKLRPADNQRIADDRSLTAAGGPVGTNGPIAIETADAATQTTISSAEIILSEIRRHKKKAAAASILLILILAGAGYWLSRLVSQSKATAPFQNMKITRLTSTGNVSEAAISPDGKYVSYATTAKGQQSIWLRHVQTSSDVQIVSPVKGSFFTDLIFSPDGNFVYYIQSEPGKPVNVLYRVPVLGGPPKKVKERIHGGLCFSPDGQRIALTRWTPRGSQDTDSKGGDKQLTVMNADGTEEQKLASRLVPLMLDNPAWSPDGRAIACTVTDSGDYSSSVIEIRLDNGSERVISSQKWFNAGHIAWLQDGSGLMLSASDSLSSPSQIWHISYPDGAARRITNDLNRYNNVSATANSRTLVTAQADQLSNIWVAPAGDSTRATQVTSGLGKYGAGSIITIAGFIKGDCGGGITWAPDGRIVYHSMASGRADIWMMDADGSNQKQLTSEAGFNFYPSVSADGRFIVFTSDRRGSPDLWRVNVDGSDPIQLTTDGGQYPRCSPDGKWIIYFASGSGAVYPARIPIEGGARERFLTKNGNSARLDPSPDGRLVACNYISTQASDWYLLMAILPADGGDPVKTFDIFTVDLVREIHWTPDGRALTYIDTRDGVSNIWSQSIDGGKPTQLTDFKSDLIFSWDWSRDGRLACARGTQTSDVVLINDFR